jgi:hypothetical protein
LTKRVVTSKEFDKLLLEAIDEALSSLGESIKPMIYFHLEQRFNIRRDEIPARIDDLSNALEHIFGFGAQQLEILFMKHLYAKIAVVWEWNSAKWIVPEVTFQEYVRELKRNLEASQNQEEPEIFLDEEEYQSCRSK